MQSSLIICDAVRHSALSLRINSSMEWRLRNNQEPKEGMQRMQMNRGFL